MTTPEQVAFLKVVIALREADLVSLEKRIDIEKDTLQNTKNTIDILSRQSSSLLRLLEIRKRDLSAHERNLSDILSLKEEIIADNEGTEANVLADWAFPDYSTQKREDISKLSAKIELIQQDIGAKTYLEPIQRLYVEELERHRDSIQSIIESLKVAFASVRRVPSEVWELIFLHRLEDDVKDYTQSPESNRFNSTPITLSQVSRPWRNIVYRKRDLWRYFICNSEQVRSARQIERWKHYCSFDPQPLVFISNLQARSRIKYPGEVETLARDAMSSYPQSIHLLVPVDNETAASMNRVMSMNRLPFRNQLSLTLQMHQSASKELLKEISACFPTFSRLKIVQKQPFLNSDPDIHRRRNPSVEFLTLDLCSFAPFRVDYYFHEEFVKEIHIMHNGNNSLVGRLWTLTYPLLAVIGITPPDTAWINPYKLPSLHRLVLYGPKLHSIKVPSLVQLSQHAYFHKVEELELHRWPQYKPTDAPSWGIIPLIREIAAKLRSVKVIRCIDSFIEGECLVALVKLLKETNSNVGASKLTTVVIDCCTGITRSDCELITSSIEKLVVHV